MKKLSAATLAVAFLLASQTAAAPSTAPTAARAHITRTDCHTPRDARRAARYAHTIYRGTARVSTGKRRHLRWLERCSEPRWLIRYIAVLARRHAERIAALPPWEGPVVASWYVDPGPPNCCGYYSPMGVAVCGSGGGPCVAMGTHIELAYGDRTGVCVADDHGPFVPGRAFDLSQGCAATLGFVGVGPVRYRILGAGP